MACVFDFIPMSGTFLVEAVDDKIKQVLFLYLAVCFGRFHTLPKQTLSLKPDVID